MNSRRAETTGAVVRAMAAHPYLCALAAVMILHPLFFCHTAFVRNNVFIGTLAAVGVGAGYLIYRMKTDMEKWRAAVIAVLMSILLLILLGLYSESENKEIWLLGAGAFSVLLLYRAADKTKYRRQLCSLLIMSLGVGLKFYYVLITSMYTRQNDIGGFDKDRGHASYIAYLLENHRLPDFDPRERWQYCHPPLHHAISAVWIWLNENLFMTGTDPAREGLQTLSLFYSMCMMITAYRILRHFRLKGKALYLPLIIINFHPAFILFSGAVNNDPLSVVFVMGAILYVLKWAKERTMTNILKLALCIGLGMMSKISAAIIAPPTALIFLIMFIAHAKKELVPMIKQFVCFGLVSVPLGMWFPVRNFLRWGMPFTYVQEMSEEATQYIGNVPFSKRITDFSAEFFSPIYEHWAERGPDGSFTAASDLNPLITLMKNSMFGETFSEETFADAPFVYKLLPVLFWTNVIIAAAAFIAMIFCTVGKCRANAVERTFIISLYAFLIGSFYKTCADYPFTCTMNYRYITPTAVIGALSLGFTLSNLTAVKKRLKRSDKSAAGAAVSIGVY